MKLETGNLKLGILTLCLCVIWGESLAREIAQSWKVGLGPSKTMSLEFFQAENIDYTHTASSYDLTGQSVTWQLVGWDDYTNVYLAVTGTVTDAESGRCVFSALPEETNLEEGTYRGFVTAYADDRKTVLAWQRVKIEWSADARNFDVVTPLTYAIYSQAEVNQIEEQLRDEINAIGTRLDAVETQTNLIHSALQAETDPLWTAASGSVYQAIADVSVEETDPVFSAWDKSTGISITESQISDLQSYLTSEVDPAWHSGTGAIYSAISEVGDQVSTVSGRVDQVESDLSAAIDLKQDAATAATDAELSAAVADAPNWTAAYAWGNHALAGYLTSYTEADPAFAAWNKSTGISITESQISDLQSYLTAESDPAWHSGTGAIYSAIGTKQDAATAATDAELTAGLATKQDAATAATDSELQALGGARVPYTGATSDVDIGSYDFRGGGLRASSDGTIGSNSAPNWSAAPLFLEDSVGTKIGIDGSQIVASHILHLMAGQEIKFQTNGQNDDKMYLDSAGLSLFVPIDMGANTITDAKVGQWDIDSADLTVLSGKVDDLESGAEDFEGLTLDSTIDSWDDLGLTYTNAVRINNPVTITNDSTWTGWTTTGTLSGTNIVLDTGDYLLSPVQPNGVADYDIAADGSGRITWTSQIVTNGVWTGEITYQGSDGQLMITNIAPMPMMASEMTISLVKLTGYENTDEAAMVKHVSNLRRIDAEYHDDDLTRKVYVDEGDAASVASAAASLASYAANADKTLCGSQLRLGNMWVVSPADASGERWICSGGEIGGGGELIGTTNEFVISKNDYPLMSFTSSSTGLYITNHAISATSSNVTVSLYISTNGVTSAPFAEWTESLTAPEWSRVSTYDTATYPTASGGTYELTFTLPLADQMFFRAMQQVGESVATIETDVFDLSGAAVTHVSTLVTTGGVDVVERALGAMFVIFAEDAAYGLDTAINGGYQWSFGNGDETPASGGIVVPFDVRLVGIGSNIETPSADSGTIVLLVNNSPVATHVHAASVNDDYTTYLDQSILITAGSRINFKTTDASGSGSCRASAFFRTTN